ncbi:MAG TPA: DUF4347 domain-containing protein [Opitutus sp.]|nr:DUF4347 domain-containing protein [Opitutus sp.]
MAGLLAGLPLAGFARATPSPDLLLVDGGLPEVSALIAAARPGTEVAVLDPRRDELRQITEVLTQRRDVAAVHIVSHGRPGEVVLGGRSIDAQALRREHRQLATWRAALAPGAEILLYACETGAGPRGAALIDTLARETGARVAASVDDTGDAARQGNWNLEATSGRFVPRMFFADAKPPRYPHVLALPSDGTFQLNGDFGSSGTPFDVDGNFTFSAEVDSSTASLQVDSGTGCYIDDNSTSGTGTITVAADGFNMESFILTSIDVAENSTADAFTSVQVTGVDVNDAPISAVVATGTPNKTTSDPYTISLTGTGFDGVPIKSFTVSFVADTSSPALNAPDSDQISDFRLVSFGISGAAAPGGGGGGGFGGSIAVLGNSNPITNGSTTPSAGDDTDFGSTAVTSGSVSHTFTISNMGIGALNLTGTPKVDISGTNAADFTVTAQPPGSVAVSDSTTFTIEFVPSASGTRTATVSIASDDSFNDPFTFDIQGTGSGGGGGGNADPTVTGLPASISLTEDSSGNLDIASSSFADSDSASITVTLVVSGGTIGIVNPAYYSLAGSGNGTGTITLTGAPSDINDFFDTPSNAVLTPPANVNGSGAVTLTVSANDGDGSGDVALGTVPINITAVNDAPSFASGATLAAVTVNATNPAGATILSLLETKFSDADTGDSFAGIAVAGNAANSGTEGKWQYSTDSGSTWFDVGTVSTSSALLLNTSSLLRFLPVASYTGTPGSLTVYAVDDSSATTFTSGSTRQTFDTTSDDATSKVAASGVSLGTSVVAGPSVVSVAVPKEGTYGLGKNLDFTVTFDSAVTITGTPQLALTIGAMTVQATYVPSVPSQPATTALFRYTVEPYQSDTNGIEVGALTLNYGTIQNESGADATLTLNAVGSTDHVLVDTDAPTVISIVRQSPSSIVTPAATIIWRVTFSEGVKGVSASDFTLTNLSGTAGGTVETVVSSSISGSTYDVWVLPTGLGHLRLDLRSGSTHITDLAGNEISGGFTRGDLYFVGVTSVFDAQTYRTPEGFAIAGPNESRKPAQRFTTSANGPLMLSTIMAFVGTITGAPVPVVTVNEDDGGMPGSVVGTFTNPSSLTEYSLTVWLGGVRLDANTTYWVVFSESNPNNGSTYSVSESAQSAGGTGDWLTAADYHFRFGSDSSTLSTGAMQLVLGASNPPVITSTLTADTTYGTAFAYAITASESYDSPPVNTSSLPVGDQVHLASAGTAGSPAEAGGVEAAGAAGPFVLFGASGLPSGLGLDAKSGVISGTPKEPGNFAVTITATDSLGATATATLTLTVAKAPLTVTADDAQRKYLEDNPDFTVSFDGFVAGDTADSLTTQPTAATTADKNSDADNYEITVSGGESSNYEFTYVAGTLTVSRRTPVLSVVGGISQTFDFGTSGTIEVTSDSDASISFSLSEGDATFTAEGGKVTLDNANSGTSTLRAFQAQGTNYTSAEIYFSVHVNRPPAPPSVPPPTPGSTLTLTGPDSTTGWQRNGVDLSGGTGTTLTISDVQPPTAGLYTYTATAPGGSGSSSEPVIVGLSTTDTVVGTASVVGNDIVHPNGNVYDQVLLSGNGALVTADRNKITRISFVDLSDDIVQVEFSGTGTLSLVMDDASAPAPAANYNQPGVDYTKGHAGVVITGADETSNLNIFTVGRLTAVNQALFKDDVDYAGIADIAFVAIQSKNGKFGAVRTGNVTYYASQGFTGVYAPGVEITGPVNIGEISAYDSARPVIVLGSCASSSITGGSLLQPNGQPIVVSGLTQLKFVDGTTSAGVVLPAQHNQGVLQDNGVDVTDQVVVNPTNNQ